MSNAKVTPKKTSNSLDSFNSLIPRQLAAGFFIDGTGVHELAVYFAPTVRVHASATAGRWEIEKLHSPYKVSFTSSADWDWEAIKGDACLPLGWFSENLGIKEPAYTLRGRYRGDPLLTVESRFNVTRCYT